LHYEGKSCEYEKISYARITIGGSSWNPIEITYSKGAFAARKESLVESSSRKFQLLGIVRFPVFQKHILSTKKLLPSMHFLPTTAYTGLLLLLGPE
jgi:hypothetical protein